MSNQAKCKFCSNANGERKDEKGKIRCTKLHTFVDPCSSCEYFKHEEQDGFIKILVEDLYDC